MSSSLATFLRFTWLNDLLQDIRCALRMLVKSPGFALAAIVVLSLGIGGTTAMFSVIHATLLKPLPFQEPGQLVFARNSINGQINTVMSGPDYYDYREQADRFDGFSAVLGGAPEATVTGDSEPEHVAFTYIEHDLFRTLGVGPLAGRSFAPEEGRAGGPPVAMVSERFARRRFHDPDHAAGAPLTMDGKPYTVIGVMPAAFRFIHDNVDVWLPIHRGEGFAGAPRQFHMFFVTGRLKPGVSRENAQRQVDVISKRLEQQYPSSNAGKTLRLYPLQAALAAPQTPRLMVLMGAVALVLLIACANVASLLLVRGSARRSELATRATLGATRARIAGQLLVESATLALLSGVLGVALALWLNRLLPLVIDLSGSGSRLDGLDWPVLLFALALSILVGVLFGAVPALRASSGYLARDLAPGVRTAGARTGTRFRSTLVTSQVAISLVLLVGAGLLIRSFARLAGTNPGFNVQQLLTGEVQLPEARYAERSQRIQFFEDLREDLRAIPGVKAVGLISSLPIRNPHFDLAVWDSDHPPARPADRRLAFRRVVLPGYFGAIGIPLLSGRDLGKEDRENAPLTTVINERTAHALFPNRNPLGERVSMDMGGSQPDTFEVVGVVGDAHLNSIDSDPPMTVYLSHQQFPDSTMRFAIRTEKKPESLTLAVRNLVLARDRSIPVDNLVSMERIIGNSLAPQQTTTILLGLLAAMALFLAAVGLYGVIAYGVSQRTQEIGIRMALGAQRSDAIMLVVKQGSTLIGLGVAVGLLGSFALTRLLTNLLSWVTPNDPMTLAWVVLLLVVTALGACWLPALRAAKIDPMVALRNP